MYNSPLNPDLPHKPGERRYWGRLYGSSKALVLNMVAEKNQFPLLVLTEDLLSANRLLEELRFYQQNDSSNSCLLFPDWETLPYDSFSPYQDIISDRLATLTRLSQLTSGILVVSVSTSMHRLMPQEYLAGHSLFLETGQSLKLDNFRRQLEQSGYRFVSQVMEHGDVAARGSLLDIYPMGAELPYRVDLFDEEIDSIRQFEPESQRSMEKIDTVRVLPAREVALTKDSISRFRSNWLNRFEGNPNNAPVYRDVSNGIAPAGIEYYLPLFYEQTHSLFDYLPDNCMVVLDEDIHAASHSFWEDIENRYEQGRYDLERPLLPPADAFHRPEELFANLKQFPQVHLSSMAQQEDRAGSVNFATKGVVKLPVDVRATEPLGILKRFLQEFEGRVLFVAESPGRRETMLELLGKHGLRPRLYEEWAEFLPDSEVLGLTVAPLEHGLILNDPRIAVISESQLFGERVQQRRLRKRKQQESDAIVRNLTELTIGAPTRFHQSSRFRVRRHA